MIHKRYFKSLLRQILVKVFCVISFLIMLNINNYSQESYSGIEVGIGSYDMKDLKYFNNQVLINLPFEAKVTENFPMYLYYKGFLKYYVTKSIGLGFKLSLNSTASRISRSDYSGDYTYDNVVYCLAPGITFDCKLFSISKIKVFIYDETGIIFSKLKLIENFRVFDQSEKTTESYKSNNIYSELGLHFSYFYKDFIFSFNSGLSVDFKTGGINNSGDLIDFGDVRNPLIQWTGFRESISISYRID